MRKALHPTVLPGGFGTEFFGAQGAGEAVQDAVGHAGFFAGEEAVGDIQIFVHHHFGGVAVFGGEFGAGGAEQVSPRSMMGLVGAI